MCAMCHACGAELTMSIEDKKRLPNEDAIRLNSGEPVRSCKFCGEKQEDESAKQDGLSPSHTARMLSPMISLSSSDSFASNCSDFSVDLSAYSRGGHEESGSDSSQEDHIVRTNRHLEKKSSVALVDGVDRNTRFLHKDHKHNNIFDNRDMVKDVETDISGNGQEARHSCDESIGIPTEGNDTSSFDEMDANVWEPPEPEDMEDDVSSSVACNDDDECSDGTKWGKPSSWSAFDDDESSGSYKFKEEKRRAMEEVKNGEFKSLVRQLLKSVGVTLSGENKENWLDIVTCLSWEAASFVKPDAIEGKAMDPEGWVKVKCIATGSRSQSELIKGLVFKKHAAHKHMPTKYKNPRLLLIHGILGQSSNVLSSFDAMEQEKDNLKSVIEMIELCHPNVVLVEKTVSRDVQESILAKGMTLVFDMKLHRLERVARCTGSTIFSSDNITNQKLKQCDSFHFEKFVEEHAGLGEGGKKPSKTLMFLEGCPMHLGCTVLLKGAHSDELKRIKCVVQIAVVMAYHLILETSFLVDQRAMFSTIPFGGVANSLPNVQLLPFVPSGDLGDPCLEESTMTTSSSTTDVPLSNGFHAEGAHNVDIGGEGNLMLSYEPYSPVIFSGFSSISASLKQVIGDSFPTAYQSMSTYLGLNANESENQLSTTLLILGSPEALDNGVMESEGGSDENKAVDSGKVHPLSNGPDTAPDSKKANINDEDEMQGKDDIGTVMDSQSILVLMSRRNALKGRICEQSHFSHIKFYRNFDVPLGKFLRDNLLNQRLHCTACNELPEAHYYYYAHHDKQLTIQIKRIPTESWLPGEAEGKIWMWSRCLKCRSQKGILKPTKRVLISAAAHGLSFGKFLELSFSHHSSSIKLSSCGHSVHRDFIYFFGLGPMVAMFRYSPVVTYSVTVPLEKLEFSNSIKQECLAKEYENVLRKGMKLFTDVAAYLQKISSRFAGVTLEHHGPLREFSDVEEMLRQESSEFEEDIQKTVLKNGISKHGAYKFLCLNRLLLELLLESYVWDRRLHVLLFSDSGTLGPNVAYKMTKRPSMKDNGVAGGSTHRRENHSVNGHKAVSDNWDPKIKLESTEQACDPAREIPIEGSTEKSGDLSDKSNTIDFAENSNVTTEQSLDSKKSSDQDCMVRSISSAHLHISDESRETLPRLDQQNGDRTIPITADLEDSGSIFDLDMSQRRLSPPLLLSKLENSTAWLWTPFLEIRQEYLKDLQRGYLPKFEPSFTHTPNCLPIIHQLITEEGLKMHIPLLNDEFVVSDFEGELSSVIACALTLLMDLPAQPENFDEDSKRERGLVTKTFENSVSLGRNASFATPYWSSSSSLDSDGTHSMSSISSEEARSTSFDGLNLLDSIISLGALHPEVSLGIGRSPGKGKYSVVCLYANRFHDLRSRFCPSELDYIASLSRCKNWDAKGGKSKSFFAKTLDDRFIIKEIKKTEFESFLKFALDYFGYMIQSFESGNQTCLAKILGIYQVTIRPKSGKETKHDLMVMENLTFGRNITRQYDLKGALHARFNSVVDGSDDVLLDQNFVDDMNTSPMYVSRKSKRLLLRGVWNDTAFLNSINVMDYSLLVGVDAQRRELACGIIDYLRQYTWDKQLETWVKSSLVVPKNVLPTVISPKEYKKRFRKFMSTYFLSVPDDWCSERFSNPCKLCGFRDEDDSSRSDSEKQGGNK
ncbi:Chaperonin Cpn60/GroEL/TCP-1 family [Dillenia turbinata]|uniref:1-phosphatidylinositol-3-phosphate 5-kinase n=1 Tax=Dillenia turbinata TaxID=194707 RepID=A0AAN8VYM7_9MAGN